MHPSLSRMRMAAVEEVTSGGQLLRAPSQHPMLLMEGHCPTLKTFRFGPRVCLNESGSVLAIMIYSL